MLHRLSVERDALEREEARAKARQAELETRLAQASRDLAREEEHIAEAEGMLRGLGEEGRRLASCELAATMKMPQLREAVAKAAEALAAAEQALTKATGDLAEARAEGGRLEAEQTDLSDRRARLETEATASVAESTYQTRERENSRSMAISPSSTPTPRALQAPSSDRRPSLPPPRPRNRGREFAKPRRAISLRPPSSNGKSSRPSSPRSSNCSSPRIPANGRRSSNRSRSKPGYEQALGAALGDDLDAAAMRRLRRIGA